VAGFVLFLRFVGFGRWVLVNGVVCATRYGVIIVLGCWCGFINHDHTEFLLSGRFSTTKVRTLLWLARGEGTVILNVDGSLNPMSGACMK